MLTWSSWYVAGSPSGYVEGRRAPEFGVQANSYDHTGFDARFPNMNQYGHPPIKLYNCLL